MGGKVAAFGDITVIAVLFGHGFGEGMDKEPL